MKGLLRAILFGVGWWFALLAIGLLVALPEATQLTNREPIVIVCSAIASALVLWTATRLPATPSWPIAIVGWIVGFFLLLGAVRVLLAIADQMFR
jgi:hypothetical protein